jgi:Xaa-Pro aminopeptidase
VIGPGSQGYWAGRASGNSDAIATGDVPQAVVKRIDALGGSIRRVGVVGHRRFMPPECSDVLRRTFADREWIDVEESFERLLRSKSTYDVRGATRTYDVAVRALGAIAANASPGMSESTFLAPGYSLLHEHGCHDGFIHLSHESAPFIRPPTDRTIASTDVLKVQVELSGPEGYWVELAHLMSFTPLPKDVERHFRATVQALGRAADALRPGNSGADIRDAIRAAFHDAALRPRSSSVGGFHGIGLNLVEPPYGEPLDEFEPDDLILLSPHVAVAEHDWSCFLPDVFLVTSQGGRRLVDHEPRWLRLGDGNVR